MTGRQLAEALLALPNPDAPVFCWAPGTYWEPETPHLHQVGSAPYAFVMIEVNQVDRHEVDASARGHG